MSDKQTRGPKASRATRRAVRQTAKWLAWTFLGICVVGGAVLGTKTALTPSRQAKAEPVTAPQPTAEAAHRMAERLGRAIAFETVSREGAAAPDEALRGLHSYLRAAFPAVHATLKVETLADHSLLYTWPASPADPASPAAKETNAKPYLLLAHQDVVPVEPGSEPRWTYPPFSGHVADGFIWGRGTLDDKGSLMAILEAVELLCQAGFRPRRTIYLAFGHDEEVSGFKGAARIAKTLSERGVRLDFVLDEGMALTRGLMPGLNRPMATIGLAEKGYLALELVVESPGGHSSMPPPHTAVGVLARAVQRLEDAPLPINLLPPTSLLFDYVAPEMKLPLRVALSNTWLLKPLLLPQLAAQPATNALLRTTTAVTMIEGSRKDNVLPQRARAVVNFRILPGDTIAQVIEHARRVIADPAVQLVDASPSHTEPSSISSVETPAFQALARSIRSLFPDAVVAPALMLGQSDSRHFAAVAENTYRFVPFAYTAVDLDRLHGTNERISIDGYVAAVRFYAHFVRAVDAAH